MGGVMYSTTHTGHVSSARISLAVSSISPLPDVHFANRHKKKEKRKKLTTTANTDVQGPYFIRQLKFVISCRYNAGRVFGGRPMEM
jgi:hypothetical protein